MSLVQTPLGGGGDVTLGSSFFFRVNGAPVFLKGANVVPVHALPERVTLQDVEVIQERLERSLLTVPIIHAH